MPNNARLFIENLLAKGQLESAIDNSLVLCRFYEDAKRGGEIMQHSARYHSLMQEYRAGTLGDDDFRPERARITRTMLDWAQNIPDGWTDEVFLQPGISEHPSDHRPEIRPESPQPDRQVPPQPEISGTKNPPGEKFRSFAKTVIADDMERGYIGQNLAFRNVRTREIICCFADAQDFSGGKARVSKDGMHYFYIDKRGKEVE